MELVLIRHGMTAGNLEKRYIGRTDEPLCEQGRKEVRRRIQEHIYDYWLDSGLVFASPMKRCMQTAELIFPGQKIHTIPEFVETDFGEFENKNYRELAENAAYRQWIDSNGTLPFPGGESRDEVRARCIRGFHKMMALCSATQTAKASCIVHGGTIMQLLEVYAGNGKDFYAYHCGNGQGYHCQMEHRAGDFLLHAEPFV